MNTTIIGVAGGTASGKSTLVKKLQEAFEGESVITLCHDYYYKAHDDLSFEERTKLNYDHPGAFDTDMMIEDIMKLKKGRSVFRPVYSFVNHNRTDKTVKVEPAQVIIIDGILIPDFTRIDGRESICRYRSRCALRTPFVTGCAGTRA